MMIVVLRIPTCRVVWTRGPEQTLSWQARQNLPFEPKTADPITIPYCQYFEFLQEALWPSRGPQTVVRPVPKDRSRGSSWIVCTDRPWNLRFSGIIIDILGVLHIELKDCQITSTSLRSANMADLLFPTLHQRLKSQPKALYAAVLTDVARAAFDGIEALTGFRALLLDSPNGTPSPGLMAFDAHVGDTGCHLRAGMFLEVYRLHRNVSPAWIDRTIHRLRRTQEKAQQICAALTQQSARPQSVGLSGKDLPLPKLFRAVDWEEISSEDPSNTPYLLKDVGDPRRSFEGDSSKSVSWSSTSSTRSRSTSPSSTGSETPLPFETRWTPDNIKMLVRLVVYSFVLSKYKSFSSVNNTVVARLCPEDTAEAGYALMQGFWDFNHSDYRKARVERFSQELRALQVWISDLSSAWLHSVAMRCSPGGMDR